MKKLWSLIKASMSYDMNLFKINSKKNTKFSFLVPIFIALYLMFYIWGSANAMFSKLAPMHLSYLFLSIFVLGVSFMSVIEGIYKSSSILFNSKDDDLLLSLPISKSRILFIRVLKYYLFEVMFNGLFFLPVIISYIRWAEYIGWTYFLTNFIMLLFLPIIPILISCLIGALVKYLSLKFKYKNLFQIMISMLVLVGVLLFSIKSENILNYLLKNIDDINALITKIYYPAGIYTKLIISFNYIDLIKFILIHVIIFIIFIYLLSKIYFKINSRDKSVISNKAVDVDDIIIKRKSNTISLIKKELNIFFKTPVFIINSGFGLVLFLLAVLFIVFKFDNVLLIIASKENGLGLSINTIMNNLSIIILILIISTSFMTSISSSLISLEGKKINILKSLPIKVKTILMSKIYSVLSITSPILVLGSIILFIKFKIYFIDCMLLLILSILIPLVSHFIGLIVNLKYPKLDAKNSTEIVKQSMSSFISVMIGFFLLVVSVSIVIGLIGKVSVTILLSSALIIYLLVDLLLYYILITYGIKKFNTLTI